MLVDWQIKALLADGEIEIDPIGDAAVQVQPVSVDLRVNHGVLAYRHGVQAIRLGTGCDDVFTKHPETELGFNIGPGEFLLASTIERVRLSGSICARVEGRSSVGRTGLFVHVTAGFVDAGFNGNITLELFNASPVSIFVPYAHRICQLAFYRIAECERPYSAERGSKYIGSAANGTVPPGLEKQ